MSASESGSGSEPALAMIVRTSFPDRASEYDRLLRRFHQNEASGARGEALAALLEIQERFPFRSATVSEVSQLRSSTGRLLEITE